MRAWAAAASSGCTSQSRAAAVVVSQVRVMSPNFLNPLAIWWTLACSHQETCDRRLLGRLRILVVDSSIGQVRVFALALVSFPLREGLVAAERELTISRRILGYAANVWERGWVPLFAIPVCAQRRRRRPTNCCSRCGTSHDTPTCSCSRKFVQIDLGCPTKPFHGEEKAPLALNRTIEQERKQHPHAP